MDTKVLKNAGKPYGAVDDCSSNYYETNRQMFTALAELIERNPKNYHHELKSSPRYSSVLAWIESVTPMLADSFYKVSTKCAWIMRGIVDFPACEACGKAFKLKNVSVRRGYPRFCSAKCSCSSGETIRRSQAKKLSRYGSPGWNNPEKSRTTRYARNAGMWERPDTGEKRRTTNLERRGCEYNFQSDDSKEKTKLTNVVTRGVEYPAQDPAVMEKAIRTKIKKYGNARGDPSHFNYIPTHERLEKNVATCMRRYGVTNGGASAEAQLKAHAKYRYNGKSFDSGPELAFEIWLNDHRIRHSYRDGSYIQYHYEYGGKTFNSRYYYDFRLACGLIVELKGRHLLDNNMKLANPYLKNAYEKGKMTESEYMRTVAKYAAKQLCMEANHVVVLTNDGYRVYEDYVNEVYGKGYIRQFRTRKA